MKFFFTLRSIKCIIMEWNLLPMRGDAWVHTTNLSPSLFIEGYRFSPLSLLNFETVPTEWYFLFTLLLLQGLKCINTDQNIFSDTMGWASTWMCTNLIINFDQLVIGLWLLFLWAWLMYLWLILVYLKLYLLKSYFISFIAFVYIQIYYILVRSLRRNPIYDD
jgi:hypothetical protein